MGSVAQLRMLGGAIGIAIVNSIYKLIMAGSKEKDEAEMKFYTNVIGGTLRVLRQAKGGSRVVCELRNRRTGKPRE